MSDPKVKPSIAARELAWKVMSCNNEVTIAVLIDLAMSDLLEKAQTLNVYIEARWGDSDATIQDLNRPLKSALEPWKPGE